MSHLRDWFAWGLARLGWPGWAGLALVLGAVLVSLVQVRPMAEEAARLALQAERLARQPMTRQVAAPPRDWRAELPPDREGYARLAKLFTAASRAGLTLAEGNYREVRDAKLGLTRLAITLPVTGNYPTIRAFLAQTLNQEPALALESLRISRGAIGDSELSADLRFTLYLDAGTAEVRP